MANRARLTPRPALAGYQRKSVYELMEALYFLARALRSGLRTADYSQRDHTRRGFSSPAAPSAEHSIRHDGN